MNCAQQCPHLEEYLQFWWGFAGGSLIVYFVLFMAAIRRRKIEKRKRPPIEALDVIIFVFWCVLPGITGLLARMTEAPSAFYAGFDGAGVSTMFYFAAAHLSGLFNQRHSDPPVEGGSK